MKLDGESACVLARCIRTVGLDNKEAILAATQVAREMLGTAPDAPLYIT